MSTMTEPMYVRFGDLPEGGRSWNDEAGQYEAGASCYRAEWQSGDKDILCVVIPDEICVGTINALADRPVYIVTGDLLGERGGDGEPLMANATATLHGPVEVVTWVVESD
jgi:hypothetical protein